MATAPTGEECLMSSQEVMFHPHAFRVDGLRVDYRGPGSLAVSLDVGGHLSLCSIAGDVCVAGFSLPQSLFFVLF